MNRRIFFCIVASFFYLSTYAQKEATLSGRVTDRKGAGLPGVSLKAIQQGNQKATVSESSGLYKLVFPQSDSIMLQVSYLGFKPQNIVLRGQKNNIQKNIVLEEDTLALGEVVVQAKNTIHKTEKSIYFPSQTQRKGTNNGIGLLFNMMIPELRVDKKTGSVVSADKKNVTLCINGVPSSVREIKALRPADVIRVDYYPIPTGKFMQYDAVVDYIVKSFNNGGYVDINTETSVINTTGEYDATVKYNHKNWTYTALGGVDFSNITRNYTLTDEWVGLTPSFEKQSETDNNKQKSFDQYINFGAEKRTQRLQLVFRTGFVGNRVPQNSSEYAVHYTPEVYPATNALIENGSKSIGANANAYMNWTITDRQYLIVNASYKYGHSNYNRLYSEDAYQLQTKTKEDNHNYNLSIAYTLSTAKLGQFAFQVSNNREVYHDKYDGDLTSKQKLINNYLIASLSYKYNFSDVFFLQTKLDLKNTSSTINDYNINKWLFLPTVYASYQTSQRGRLMLNLATGYVDPPISWKSDVYQNVNAYEQIRGNQDLYQFVAYLPSLSYVHSLKNVDMSLGVNAFLSKHSIQDTYLIEGNKLVHTYSIGEAFHQYMFNYSLTTYLLNRNLQLSANLIYARAITNNEERKHWDSFAYQLGVLYSCGDFTFSGRYSSKYRGIQFTGSEYTEVPHTYSFSASYSKGNWYAAVDFNNIFEHKNYYKEHITSSVYRRTITNRMTDFSPSITFSLSYNFDFGHKKVERSDDDVDKKISTGFLRPKE